MIASPFKTIIVSDTNDALAQLLDVICENDVVLAVIGIPIGLKGQETKQTKHVREFADLLAQQGVDIALEDERLSSVSAKRSVIEQQYKTGKRKDLVDQTAAAIFLQQYIDKHY